MNRNNKFLKILVIAAVILVLFLIIVFSHRIFPQNNPISKLSGKIIDPILGVFRRTGGQIKNGVDSMVEDDELTKEDLMVKIAVLEDENRKLYDIVQKSEALKNEYELRAKTKNDLIEARISARESGSWFDLFTIDKGTKDGVKNGDTVVVAVSGETETITGLVGKVTLANENYSNVSAITDDNIRVSIMTLRSRDGGILTGVKNGDLYGYMFDRNADIIVGDKVVSSGLGGLIKGDIYIGEVTKVESDEALLKKLVYIKPATDFKKLDKVFVVK